MAVTANVDCPTIGFNGGNLLKLEDALDNATDPAVPIEGATVEAQLDDVTDPENVVAIVGPIALSEFPSGPSNDYRATFVATTAEGFFVGQRVKITYSLDDGSPVIAEFVVVALVCEQT